MRLHRLSARCSHGGGAAACARPAVYSQRLLPAARPPLAPREQTLVGGAELYQPACALHHSIAPLPHAQWFAKQAQ